MNIDEIWKAIDKGKTVNWHNDLYKVYAEDYPQGINEVSKLSYRGGKVLSIRCIENYFGSVIHKAELDKCYIEGIKQ